MASGPVQTGRVSPVSDGASFLWHRWFSPPVNLAFLTCYWVQSAPYLQRRSARRWAPVWTAQKGCWLPVQACSSSTSIRTVDDVSTPPHTHTQPESQLSRLSVCTLILRDLVFSCSVLYSNTEQASVYLTRSSPLSLSQSIQYSSRTIYLCWHYLTDAVR